MTEDSPDLTSDLPAEPEPSADLVILDEPSPPSSDADLEEIQVLKDLQLQAINARDFKRAAELQSAITELANQNASVQVAELTSALIATLRHIVTVSVRRRAQLVRTLHNTEIHDRQAIEDQFEELTQRHVGELRDLEEQLFQAYKDKMTKPILLYDQLSEQSRQTALLTDFARAQELQDRANDAQKSELESRENTFRDLYKMRMNALLIRQANEITKQGAEASESMEWFEKRRSQELKDETNRLKRELYREYKRAVDTVTRPFNPSVPAPKTPRVDPKLVPDCLNGIEDAYKTVLVQCGLAEVEVVKGSMIAPGFRPESQLSVRLKSRVETREDEWKTKHLVERPASRTSRPVSSASAARLKKPE
jgi:hypothetical protein